jgi:monofunctional biosynthetic peptidoglycan transglycosylase
VAALRLGRLFWRLAGLLALLVLLWHLWVAVCLLWWRWVPPGETAFMDLRKDEMREDGRPPRVQYQWVDYERISPHLKRALVASEDAKFLSHDGFDWDGMEKAMQKNLRRGRIVAGGSTISQQLAKNLFLSGERSIVRKVEEAVITVMLETLLPKRRILELYCNVIEWGDGVFGAEAAARHYYGVPARGLGPAQAARLAAMVPNPRLYDRLRQTPGLAKRTAIIQARMPQAAIPR